MTVPSPLAVAKMLIGGLITVALLGVLVVLFVVVGMFALVNRDKPKDLW